MPVRMRDGSTRNMGLLEVFERSGEISALAETEPPSLVAQYRLLLAITHRALTRGLGRWTDSDRAEWYRKGLPVKVIHEYLEHWRERFWLFHPEHPFMQVAALAHADETKDKKKPWTQISLASATGNTPVLFDHSMDDSPVGVSPDKALRCLLGYLQFVPGGLVKVLRGADKSGPLCNSAAVMPTGESLAQSIMLCLHPSPVSDMNHDIPAWERNQFSIAGLLADPMPATGPNDRYTRQSRAVLLIREEDGDVKWIYFAAGYALDDDENAPDPMVCFRASKDRMTKLTFNEGRAFWRDLPALVPSGGGKIAAVINHAINLHMATSYDDKFQPVLAAGLSSDKAKLVRWRVDQIELPCALIKDFDKAHFLSIQLDESEEIYDVLKNLATSMVADMLPDSESKDSRKRAREIVDAGPLTPCYFAVAERYLSGLIDLIAEGSLGDADHYWSRIIQKASRESWSQLCGGMGNSARAVRAIAKHEARLYGLMSKLVDRSQEMTKAEG